MLKTFSNLAPATPNANPTQIPTSTPQLKTFSNLTPPNVASPVLPAASESPSLGGFARNLGSSALDVAKGLGTAVAHPIKTVESVANIGAGGIQELAGGALGTGKEQNFNSAAQYFNDRYGISDLLHGNLASGVHKIANTAYKDPAGFLLDLSTALDAGAGIAGKIGDVTKVDAIANAGEKAGQLAEATDPLKLAGKGIKAVASQVPGASELGQKLADLTKAGVGKVTGLKTDTIDQILKNPNNFTPDSMQSFTREGISRDILGDVNKKLEAVKESGAGYQDFRDLKKVDTSVAPTTSKIVKEGKNSVVYDLKEAPNDKLSIPELRQKMELLKKDPTYAPEDIKPVQKAIDERAPVEVVDHQVKVTPTYLQRTIGQNTGVTFKDGVISTTGSAAIRDAKDVRALQNLYDTWSPEFKKGYLTSNEFLNFREDLSKLSKFEKDIGRSAPLENLSKKIRANFNTNYRDQIPGLEAKDTEFSGLKNETKQIKKDYFMADGTLKDNAVTKISNLTNKGREEVLSRLERVSPGAGDKIRTLRAVEDIQKEGSGLMKTARSVGEFGGLVTLNPHILIPAILSEPAVATKILRAYGEAKGIVPAKLTKIINDYQNFIPSARNATEAGKLEQNQ